MKRLALFIAIAGTIGLHSCKEVGPDINFDSSAYNDSTYKVTAESPMPKKVLAEEFTGVSCPPCPGGHALMKAISQNLGGNIVVLSYHIFNYPQASPVEENGVRLSKYDFRTQDATDVGASIFGGIGAMPLAGFDRIAVDNSITINKPNWSSAAEARAKVAPPMNIHIDNAYDNSSREVTIKVTVAYTSAVTARENLTVCIIEDSIVDAQKDGLSIDSAYVHEHVLRNITTAVKGDPIPPKVEPKEAGKVYTRTLKDTLSTDWNANHCRVVAFVGLDEGDRHIEQAEEADVINQ